MDKVMYRAHRFRDEVEKVVVESTTPHFATLRVEDKNSRHGYHRSKEKLVHDGRGTLCDTWQEAKDRMLIALGNKFAHYERLAEETRAQWAKALALKNPEGS